MGQYALTLRGKDVLLYCLHYYQPIEYALSYWVQILSLLYIVLRFHHPEIVEARIRNAPCPFLPQMIVKFLPRQRPGAEAGPHLQIDHGLNTPGSQARSSKQSTQPNGGKFEARAPMPGEVRSVSSWTRVIKIFSFCPDLSRKSPKTWIRRC